MNPYGHASLPISYAIDGESYSKDTRFLNITIDVLHTGINANGSIFTKEVVDANIASIFNTPILGYIEGEDFTQHEYRVQKTTNGELQYIYAGHAYGVIPESCDPRWITKVYSFPGHLSVFHAVLACKRSDDFLYSVA